MEAKRTKLTARHCARLAVVATLAGILAPETAGAQAPLGPAKTDSPVTLEQGGGFLLLDLTKKDDKTSPVIRLGYQSFVGDVIRRRQQEDPKSDIHGIPYYSVNLAGAPSNDIANIFDDGNVATSAEVLVSFGHAYLLSYATPGDIGVTASDVRAITALANEIEQEIMKPTPDQQTIMQAKSDLSIIKNALEQKKNSTNRSEYKLLFQAATDYADAVIRYADAIPNVSVKPAAPDPRAIIAQRGPIYDAWFIRLGLNAGTATFFDASNPFGEQFSDEDYTGYSAQIGYNVRFGGPLPLILAVSGGVIQSNNVDELSSIEVTETQTFTSPDGVTIRGTTQKRAGLVGEFSQETDPVGKFDLVFYPWLAAASRDGNNLKSTLALDLFGRVGWGTPLIYGIGAYVTQPGSPTSVYGGLNVYRAENEKLAIDLVVGFPF